jgi:TonB family protein
MQKTELPIDESEIRARSDSVKSAFEIVVRNVPARLHKRVIAFFVVAISLAWLWVLTKTGLPSLLIPWFVVFWLGFLWGIKDALRGDRETPQFKLHIRVEEPDRLKNWLALSYLSGSLLIFSLLAKVPFEVFHKPTTTRQVVDIQLVSNADFEDRHDILPSTEQKPSLRKRSGDVQEVVDPSNRNFKPARSASKPTRDRSSESVPVAAKPDRQVPIKKNFHKQPADPTFFIAQEKPEAPARNTQVVPKNFPWPQYSTKFQVSEMQQYGARVTTVSSPKIAYSSAPIEVEEVHPPQLLEVTDNDGDIGAELWQMGGRSKGGKGAPSLLSTYLKEMHRKLKKTWSPPSGTSRRAQVLFRLRRDGTTVSVKLSASSGDPSVDQSALQAIATAAPFGNLPKDYLAEYLDVLYTFNYRADELTEVIR